MGLCIHTHRPLPPPALANINEIEMGRREGQKTKLRLSKQIRQRLCLFAWLSDRYSSLRFADKLRTSFWSCTKPRRSGCIENNPFSSSVLSGTSSSVSFSLLNSSSLLQQTVASSAVTSSATLTPIFFSRQRFAPSNAKTEFSNSRKYNFIKNRRPGDSPYF